MNNDYLNPNHWGSNSLQNPRQNTPEVSDGSPTKEGVTGQNPATQTKQQTAQMPMKSTIAAQTAQQSIDGGSASKPADDGLMYKYIGICSLVCWPGNAECEAINGHFV
jgi:hypothetical protein